MNKNSDPINFLIEFAWANGADKFTVNNAKDELKKLRNTSQTYEVFGYCRINDRGDFYNPSILHNPYLDQETVLPIYCNKEEFKQKVEWLKNRLTE